MLCVYINLFVVDLFIEMYVFYFQCHPDSSKSSVYSAENTVKFTEIMEAYRILSRPDARVAYDFYLKNPAGKGFGTVYE